MVQQDHHCDQVHDILFFAKIVSFLPMTEIDALNAIMKFNTKLEEDVVGK